MFNIGYFKGQSTEYIMKYVSGRIGKEGMGLSFYYLKYRTQIVAVSTSSTDANFVFNELTRNFQAVTIQGQFTYRIPDAKAATSLLNFTINPVSHAYLSNDPERLPQRIINIIQTQTHSEIQKRSLEETLGQSETIAASILKSVYDGKLLASMGVDLLSVHFLSVRPTPEVAKALEAGYREALLKKADEAIYARRAAAVEEERKIKENELNTQTTLEEQRRQLISLQGENARQEAEHRGKALELEAEYSSKVLKNELAIYASLDPRSLLALGFKELGQNASRIGNLTITSEILSALLNAQSSSTNVQKDLS